MMKKIFVSVIMIFAILSSLFGTGASQPVLAATTTLAEVAGVTAWYNAGATIDLAQFISGFSTVEYQTPDLVVGTVDIPVYVDEYTPYVMVHSSGYILAFYPKGDPAGKMIDVIAKQLNTTLLEYAVVMVGAAGGLTVADVTYYDFNNPLATDMLVLAENRADGENTFSLQMPANIIDEDGIDPDESVIYDYVYYDKSYGFYQTYLPEFKLNDINFVLDNADFVGPGFYGSIFGHFRPDITDLDPEALNAFTVNSGSTSAFGAIVLTYSYTLEGIPVIEGADLMAEFTLAVPGAMGGASFDLAPSAISKDSPIDGASGEPLDVTLDWSDSTAPNYEYCIDMTYNDACDLDNWISTPTAVSQATLSGLLFGTTYYWQVRAANSSETVYADNGVWWSFTTEAFKAPAAFYKVSPLDEAVELSPNGVVLDWNESYGAYSYEYCVTESESCAEVDWVNVGTETSVTVSDLQFETIYNWQVRAVNTSYTTDADGGYWSFTTLDSFSKLTPIDGAVNQKTRLTLTWEKLGTATYEYCIDTTDDDACASWVSTGTATKVTLSLTAGSTYYWQVRANGPTTIYANDDNSDLTSEFWSFTVKSRTTPPTSKKVSFEKISPQDGATDVLPTTVTLKWINVGASEYQYCIAESDSCEDTDWVSTGTVTSVTISDLTHPTTYYWQVRATINGVLTYADKDDFWEFTTTYSKLTPEDHALDQAVNNLELSWEGVPNATGYQYCLTTKEYCIETDFVSSGTGVSVIVPDLDYGTRYYWQVRANVGTVDAPVWLYANGSSVALWRFTTETLEKISPKDDAIDQPINITLDWGDVSGAIAYEYCLYSDTPCTEWTSTAESSTATITDLDYATVYYWQVRANVGTVEIADWLYADGSPSAYWQFTTEDLVKISPVDGALDQPIDPTLDWGDVSKAIEYQYCLNTTQSCNTWVSTGTTSKFTLSELEYSTLYYWQVRANVGTVDAPVWLYADGVDTAFWSFTTIAEPVVEP